MTAAITFDSPLTKIVAKGADLVAEGLKLDTVGDLLYHYPRRYVERGEYTEIGSLTVGEEVTIMGQVRSVTARPMRNRPGKLVEVVVADDSGGRITLTFFNQPWRERHLRPGRWGMFGGKVTEFNRKLQLNGPDYVLFSGEDGEPGEAGDVEDFADGALLPVYPASAKVKSWQIARCVRLVLDVVSWPDDPLPAEVRAGRNLVGLEAALRGIHRPQSYQHAGIAKRRLKWDEAFAVQVTLVQRKHRALDWPAKPRPRVDGGLLDTFDAGLPYELTAGQRTVGAEIGADLARPHPMHRLLQGEVGSGKTLCALRAILQVVDARGQAALLAPTEVLAAQHYRNISDLLGPMGRAGEIDGAADGTRIALVTGSQGAAARRRAAEAVASGSAGIVVGTHALLYEGVDFADLGLIVVDEQHRFGVEQRDALRAKADQPPHVLVMTATPIPRTVAMTVYGDLEISTLSELPKGRSPIESHVVPMTEKPHFLERAWRRLREEVDKGHQAYVVCPRIGGDDAEPGGADDGKRPPLAVLDVAPLLSDGPLHGLRIGILHGRLPADEKDAVMRAFAARNLDVLVATTVIEVGVDVPNATMMMVMDADRFGVSQLHQLRGRVGRGFAPGLCLLVSEAVEGSPTRQRLDAVADTLDGFRLAEVDLEQRREGDVLGATQSGNTSQLKLLRLLKDSDTIQEARADAIALVADDPELVKHPALAATVARIVVEERAEYLEKG